MKNLGYHLFRGSAFAMAFSGLTMVFAGTFLVIPAVTSASGDPVTASVMGLMPLLFFVIPLYMAGLVFYIVKILSQSIYAYYAMILVFLLFVLGGIWLSTSHFNVSWSVLRLIIGPLALLLFPVAGLLSGAMPLLVAGNFLFDPLSKMLLFFISFAAYGLFWVD